MMQIIWTKSGRMEQMYKYHFSNSIKMMSVSQTQNTKDVKDRQSNNNNNNNNNNNIYIYIYIYICIYIYTYILRTQSYNKRIYPTLPRKITTWYQKIDVHAQKEGNLVYSQFLIKPHSNISEVFFIFQIY